MKERTPRVLLADDDAVAQLVSRAALESGGFAVIGADDGAAAVEQFVRHRPDLVILDVVMPRLDGYEACRRIRATPAGRDVPILVMTSHDDVEAVARAYDTGATDFLSKGVSNRLMIERVRFVLREFEARRELEVSRARLAMVQDMARIGRWEVDGVGRTIHLSGLVQSLIGVGDDSAAHLAHLVAALEQEHGRQVLEAFRAWQQSRAPFQVAAVTRSGGHLHINGATTTGSDAGGAATLTLAVQDVSGLRRAWLQSQGPAASADDAGLRSACA